MSRRGERTNDWKDDAGFTLIEALVSTALMTAILGALATVTSQWMTNWSRGFSQVQQTELAATGLERIVADLAAAQFILPTGDTKGPLFDGRVLSVTFVRSALGPNTGSGLEFVRLGETADERGFATVRTRAPFLPLPATAFSQIRLSDPVVLLRAPYRISFAYAGSDRVWRSEWYGTDVLPAAVQITLRDVATARTLAVSTTAIIHVDASADCARAKEPRDCDVAKAAASE